MTATIPNNMKKIIQTKIKFKILGIESNKEFMTNLSPSFIIKLLKFVTLIS